ncbi:heavy-metal-associated domain-containing protein [Deferrisoma camini]|uniref:heavy-metal-associated domain-containing protein n=1 Tax=Deferrisoma camini TaxID=1035120 RepID=UPI00046C9B8C|nr:heavy metal-associated domain-containing protein [Deferrisoma camini]
MKYPWKWWAGVLAGGAVLVVWLAFAGFPDEAPAAAATDRVLFAVEGLSCGSCEGQVVKALQAQPGVRAVGVDLRAGRVVVEYEPAVVDAKRLADAVTRIGYPARYLASGPSVPLGQRGQAGDGGCGGSCCQGAQ